MPLSVLACGCGSLGNIVDVEEEREIVIEIVIEIMVMMDLRAREWVKVGETEDGDGGNTEE